MFPSILTSTLELNIPYFNKLTAILCLDDEEYEASFDSNSPESFNDFLQIQFIHWLINAWIVELKKTPLWTIVSVKGRLLSSNC
jgi:hypothetical protein